MGNNGNGLEKGLEVPKGCLGCEEKTHISDVGQGDEGFRGFNLSSEERGQLNTLDYKNTTCKVFTEMRTVYRPDHILHGDTLEINLENYVRTGMFNPEGKEIYKINCGNIGECSYSFPRLKRIGKIVIVDNNEAELKRFSELLNHIVWEGSPYYEIHQFSCGLEAEQYIAKLSAEESDNIALAVIDQNLNNSIMGVNLIRELPNHIPAILYSRSIDQVPQNQLDAIEAYAALSKENLSSKKFREVIINGLNNIPLIK